MILSHAIFGLISSALILIGAGPYIRDILNKKAHPHVLSWLGWGFITALGASAMYADGSTWPAAIVFANSVACLTIVLFSIINKVGIWQTSFFDWFFFGMGLLGIVLWQTLDLPVLALICALVADFSFGVPTIIKTYKDPSTETPFVWVAAASSGLFSIFAIEVWAFYEAAYPVYLLIFDTIVLLLVLRIVKRPAASTDSE